MSEIVWRPRPAAPASSHFEGLPPLIAQLAAARGYVSDETLRQLVAPTLKSLRDPMSLRDMPAAIERLLVAFHENHKICLYGDFDLDGTSGVALLSTGLTQMGFDDVMIYQPSRLSEGYGVHPEAICTLHAQGVQLIVTVDVGTTAFEAIEKASELGVDVIVTDHHQPKETLPNACAVVNPNAGGCTSGLGHLSGAGVAFYLVLALRKVLIQKGVVLGDFDPKHLLDCFVIGTLADMVPLREENRVLVRHGLLQLSKTQRPALRNLIEALGLLERPLTSQDVAIQLAPKLNALSRMERGLTPLQIFTATDKSEAQDLTSAVLANNDLRKQVQTQGEEELLSRIQKETFRYHLSHWSEALHKGVVGLLATRGAEVTGLPSFVGTVQPDGYIVGSARMPDGSSQSVLAALESAASCLVQFGGHEQAAGFKLQASRASDFVLALDTYFSTRSSQGPRTYEYDTEVTFADVHPELMGWLEKLEPFGREFPQPLFCFRDVSILEAKPLRGGHLKLRLKNQSRELPALLFGKSASSAGWEAGQRVDILAEPQWNFFRGSKSLQLLLRSIRPHQIQNNA